MTAPHHSQLKEWLKKFNVAIGSSNPRQVAKLKSTMQVKYSRGIGELIRVMTTCHPDLAYASVILSQ
jgi:hypothetical protein